MWSTLLVGAFFTSLNPVRLAIALLVISRPRPVQNLLAYWLGCLMVSVLCLLIPLTVLHGTPLFKSFADELARSSAVRHFQIGVGVLALSVAALMTVLSLTRRRQRAQVSTAVGQTSTLVIDTNAPSVVSRLLGQRHDPPPGGGSAFRRLLGRAHDAWESGSLWVAVLLGILSGPGADEILYVLAIIVASGAAIGTQLSAAMTFAVGTLAVLEITLVSYLATPAKTQALLQLLHDWARIHRRKILITMCTLSGVSLLAYGMGAV